MSLLAAEPSSTTGLLFPCQYPCGTILVTMYSMVWDRRVSSAGLMHFYDLAARYIFISSRFPLLVFQSMGWYCGAGVFELMGF